MLYILAVALLLTCSAAQSAERTIVNATLGGILQNNSVTSVNYIKQYFQSALPLPYAINQCTKMALTDTTYVKFTCADDGMSVDRQTYTDAACTTTQGSPVTFTNTTTEFFCGGTDEYVLIDLSVVEDCDPAVPVAVATDVCLVTQLGTSGPVTFRLFCSDEDDWDVAQLQVFSVTSACASTGWEYSIQTSDECGALFALGASLAYGKVTGCSQQDIFYEEDTDSAAAASYMIALVISMAAAMMH